MAKKIEIYSTPTCPYCNALKEHLTKKNVQFTNYDVSTDQAKAQEMIQKSGQMGVPVTVVSDFGGKAELIVGFDEKAVDKALA